MKTLNFYFDFEFTSLSPDAQPISLGIVSDEIIELYGGIFVEPDNSKQDRIEAAHEIHPSRYTEGKVKSFYAEFSDFDLNRCDDWVKENVVSKLRLEKCDVIREKNNQWESKSHFGFISDVLKEWLSQFSDYQIQFVCDCGSKDWEWMLQLLAEWEETPAILVIAEDEIKDKYTIEELQKAWRETPTLILNEFHTAKRIPDYSYKTGLPKLPENISPVTFDLNDLIAIKKGITPKEAFDLDREELFNKHAGFLPFDHNKHNALCDAKVIKEIYNKLK